MFVWLAKRCFTYCFWNKYITFMHMRNMAGYTMKSFKGLNKISG
jgi:hypothetical protein